MLTLCIDTAYKYLTVALIDEKKIVESISFECFKRQSEEVFVCLEDLFKKANVKKSDIDAICISKGPGSYTGVRIAMTIAKVVCEIKKIKLYTISTLRLYAGNKPNCMVIMDARANRAYVGVYDQEKCILSDCILENSVIDKKDYDVILDGSLIGLENNNPDIPKCFFDTKNLWEEVQDVNFLSPEYLKESNVYYR